MKLSDLKHKSVLVVAHPDDEVLWFSSIMLEVEKIIICFSKINSRPGWTEGRRRCLDGFPFSNMVCLELTESAVFRGADWPNPVVTEYGLRVRRPRGLCQDFQIPPTEKTSSY